eukprot:TRINITY_DN9664_c0_g1_i1.p1 TRINITY_DN9664_c0_g1~~TRINITY_DN9664_c0_g1_i1.p1  ORF type:complete len:1205 (+),score=388.94 TRINITY_DN9664_c0_g1_i1:219-3617(+)
MAAPALTGQGRLAEEQGCLRTILHCLDAAMRQHAAPILPGAPLPTHGAASLEEAAEYFDLIISLLAADTNTLRVSALVFDAEPCCVDVLVNVLKYPTPAHQAGHQPYANCRVLCIQTLTKVLSLCTGAGTQQDPLALAPPDPAAVPASLPGRCLERLEAAGFVPFALAHLAPGAPRGGARAAPLADNEAERIALAECLFVLVMRIDGACAAVARDGGVRALADTLFADPSVMVRNYTSAVLRVLAERAPGHFAEVPVMERALGQIKVEHSKYVVILLFEILALLFEAFPEQYYVQCHDDPRARGELFRVIRTFLAGNANQDVLGAVGRLSDTVCLLEGRSAGQRTGFLSALLSQDGWKPLLAREAGAEQAAGLRVLKVRALRRAAQCCTSRASCEELHNAFTHFFPSLSLLFNAGLQGEGSGPPPAEDPAAAQDFRTEIALCFATILAKNPRSRDYVRDTIRAYPVWTGQLRQRLLAALDAPAAVLNGVFIIDVNVRWVNDIRAYPHADYRDRGALAALAAELFAEQEQVYAQPQPPHPPAFRLEEEEFHTVGPSGLPAREQKALLTHALLAHALHATLTPPPAGPSQISAAPPSEVPPFSPPLAFPSPHKSAPEEGGAPPLAAGVAATNPDADAAGIAMMASLGRAQPSARGPRSASASRSRPRSARANSRAFSPDKRPPWNSGGNAGKKGLFSAPSLGAKRSNFTPSKEPRSPGRTLGHSDQDYVDMAILMHLPITFGACYNKRNKPLLRCYNAGGARPYVQQLQKSTTLQSWEVKDLRQGDLFAFFIPFHKLSEDRVTHEIARLHRHMTKMRKGHLTTPHSQKGLRWFFYDMQHYILPKMETLLADLRDLVAVHGSQNLIFYLNIIRLMEQGKEQKARNDAAMLSSGGSVPTPPRGPGDGLLQRDDSGAQQPESPAAAFEREDLLQAEVLTLSRGKYRDTVHCGNIIFVLDRLKAYFQEHFSRGEVQVSDHLRDIETEIRRLEEKAARDVPGNERQAEEEDDVESEYDSSDTEDAVVPGTSAQHQARHGPPELDHPGGVADAEFSTETASDVAANLERLRMLHADEGSDYPPGGAPPPGWGSGAPDDPRLSPQRRGGTRPPAEGVHLAPQQAGQPQQGDEWASDSTISF